MKEQIPLRIRPADDAAFTNFFGPRNRDTADRLERWCQEGGPGAIVLCGDRGTGKSHLLQACCQLAREQGEAAVMVSLNELRQVGPEALLGLEHYTMIGVDDLDEVAGAPQWEEAVFGLYNRMVDHRLRLVIALSQTPAHTGFVLPDLVSRLQQGLLLKLRSYRDEDRVPIFCARAAQRGLTMSEDVAAYILRRAPRGMDDLVNVLDQLDQKSLVTGRKLTIPFVKSVMEW